MAPLCCPRCRLLQRGRLCLDCGERTATLEGLTRTRIEGLTTTARPPPQGWRDALALYATAFGSIGAGLVAMLYTGSATAMLVAPLIGILGYKKQFWKAVFKRGPRLTAVVAPGRPAGAPLVGVAQPFERTVAGGALAIATTIENSEGVIVRAVDAAPFWLVLADRRVLVAGACWIAGVASASLVPASGLLHELEVGGLPIGRASKAGLRVTRVAIAPGDRIAVLGRAREEQLAGVGGYRDSLTETIRGEPGALVWIDRLDARPRTAGADLPPERAPAP